MQNGSETDTDAVTVCISVRAKRGHEQDLEAWLQGVGRAASQFTGHQGLTVLRPAGSASTDYVYIFRFDNYAHLKAWEDSEIRRQWVKRLDDVTVGKARKRSTILSKWRTTSSTMEPVRLMAAAWTRQRNAPLPSRSH